MTGAYSDPLNKAADRIAIAAYGLVEAIRAGEDAGLSPTDITNILADDANDPIYNEPQRRVPADG